MNARYNGLSIRTATKEETENAKRFWQNDFSGYMAVRPNIGTFYILRGSKGWTPHGTYRINAEQTELIHAGYSGYDLVYLENGVAVSEALDVEDRF